MKTNISNQKNESLEKKEKKKEDYTNEWGTNNLFSSITYHICVDNNIKEKKKETDYLSFAAEEKAHFLDLESNPDSYTQVNS